MGWGLSGQGEGSPVLKARPSATERLTNGSKVPGCPQLPLPMESAMIYGIEARGEQLSELEKNGSA